MKKIPQDIIGSIAILKFPRKTFNIVKKIKARKFLKQHKTITTVVEKTDKISGRLRVHKTKHLAGEKTKETIHNENRCKFKINVDETYFSPRLSNERKLIATRIMKLRPKKILVMFAGISPYPLVIAKFLKQASKKATIISNEINQKANIYGQKNIQLNKFQKTISLLPGDAKKIPLKTKEKFDIIVMPRPNLKDTFLKTALKLSKKTPKNSAIRGTPSGETTIFYHGFGTKEEVLKEIKKDTKNKIGKIKIRKAGDIGVGKWRWLAEFKVK
jgi:tRNA (guanine37-N1)-methyltransferase